MSGDVEAIRIVVDSGIAVGRGGAGNNKGAGWDGEPVELDIFDGQTDGIEGDREMPHGLLDGIRRQLGTLGQWPDPVNWSARSVPVL
jgi:hypothetical protein